MRRRYIAPAIGLIVAAQFQREHESSECKEPPCAVGQNVTMPEPQHVPEEPPTYDAVPIRMVEVGSPLVEVPWGSDYHLEYLRITGQTLEDVL